MKNILFILGLFLCSILNASAQNKSSYKIPKVADSANRIAIIEEQWKALHQNPPNITVRDCFLF